jgi:hypothetical protein
MLVDADVSEKHNAFIFKGVGIDQHTNTAPKPPQKLKKNTIKNTGLVVR